MRRAFTLGAMMVVGTTGCGADAGSPRGAGDETDSVSAASRVTPLEDLRIRVMTQNVYLGMDVDRVMAAETAEDVPIAVAAAWQELVANRSEERAAAIAESVDRNRPALVALQELALIRRFPADGGAPHEIDFLVMLEHALAKRGLHYRAEAVQTNTDVMVPMFAGLDSSGTPILDGVQVVDRDAILVRSDVATSRAEHARYAASLPVPVGGAEIEIVRGWSSVVVRSAFGAYRFVSTHLEDHVPAIQAAQASELLGLMAAEKLPVVLAGDFNSRADGSTTPAYGNVVAAGFRDVWPAANGARPGFTCCRASDLRAPEKLTERLDIVFVRGRSARSSIPGFVAADLVGDERRDRTPSGLWASDHAGVVASFRNPTLW